jgi:predicted TIM-barrel fold metal-dependent hydrolase
MLIDVNVNVSRWPARRLPNDEPARLLEKLKSQGVTKAFAGSFDALLHKDIGGVNSRLAAECEKSDGLLLPVGAINPALPDWQDDVRRCVEQHRMTGVRLHPNYHGYGLDDPRTDDLLGQCVEHGLLVQVAVSMEDDRTQHPLMRAAAVDVRPLAKLLQKHSAAVVILLNALRSVRLEDLSGLMEAGRLFVEIATLEGVAGIEKLLKHVALERILFGSHFPFFYHEAATLKLQESELSGLQREAIMHGNAAKLLGALGR